MRTLLFVVSMLLLASSLRVLHTRGDNPEPKLENGPPTGRQKEPTINLPLSGLNKGSVTGLAFSPDGKTLAIANGAGVIHFYDPLEARERRPAWESRSGEQISGITYSPEGSYLAGCLDGGTVILLDATTLATRVSLPMVPPSKRHTHGSVTVVSFAPGGKILAGAGLYGQIAVWDVPSGRLNTSMTGPIVPYHRPRKGTELGAPEWIRGLAFSPDGKTLYSRSKSAVRAWDPASGEERSAFSGLPSVGCMALSPDGKTLAAGEFPGRKAVSSAGLSPDGKTIAVGEAEWRMDHRIVLWDTATGAEAAVVRGRGPTTALAFLAGGRALASLESGEAGQAVRLWDVATGRPLDALEIRGAYAHFVASPDGHLLAVGGMSNPTFGIVHLVETDGKVLRHREATR